MNRMNEHGSPRLRADADEGSPGVPSPSRRRFLNRVILAAGSLAGLVMAAPVIGFLLQPILRRPAEVWRKVGAVDDFTEGETAKVAFTDARARSWSGAVSRTGAWLQRVRGEEFIAYALDCTHLGCPVQWEPGAQLFMCPCHGGVYYKDGTVAGGPPPEPLNQYPVRVRDGQVEIGTMPLPIT